MADRTTIEIFEGDTPELAGVLKTKSTIAPSQWANAAAELIIISAGTRTPCDFGGALQLDVATKRVNIVGMNPPPAGSYFFRIRVTFSDGSKRTFPNGERWNTLRVIKAT